MHNKYFVDEGYGRGIVEPLRGTGRTLFGVDNVVIDGLVWLATAVPRGVAFLLQGLQRGALQGYALAMAIGIVLVLVLVLGGSE